MRTFLTMASVAALLACAGCAAVEPQTQAANDAARFKGAWRAVTLLRGGEPYGSYQGGTVVFDATTMTVFEKDSKTPLRAGSYEIDPSHPGWIAIRSANYGDSEVLPGIYKFDGNQLEICVDISGRARPAQFDSPAGTALQLMVLKPCAMPDTRPGKPPAPYVPVYQDNMPEPMPATRPSTQPANHDAGKFKGDWQIVSITIGGQPRPAYAGGTAVIDGASIILFKKGATQPTPEGNYRVDPSHPGWVDFGEKSDTAGKGMRGIYQFDGDQLEFCLDTTGERPDKFASPAKSKVHLVVLKRAAPATRPTTKP